MSIETWMVYALAVLILTASPGPSSLLCMTKVWSLVGVVHSRPR